MMFARTALRVSRQTRSVSTIKPFYTAESTATGGRNGFVKGTEGFETELATPGALNGKGASATRQNPEILFSSGYAACFLGAIHAAGGQLKVAIPKDATVTAKTSLGHIVEVPNGPKGFGLSVDIIANLPGIDKAKAREIVDKAHNDICPYSKAVKGNIVVNVSVE
ncbi:OsmC-like protein [Rhizoclosmatium globosum]|uniref:OsmC-like protein n=1 Tax=Rhizoclosmatium globosum TaxID=329046 RepID=A0A1Y2CNC2_9FUNG|nr:OsmC-like protein [Rhizoclosmatium globosum]|eukprot:ORY48531.1 OsmC-like protein [Rhizoclosmatium globosum]